jgi:dTDP-4-amino-4,6-dideoxygalactose transaminase
VLGIDAEDEVVTTPFTFVSTAEVIAQAGAKPVFCDIDPDTFNIDVASVEERLSEKTKALIPVHLYGQPVNLSHLTEIAETHNLKIIEDAAQAVGAEWKNKRVCSFGEFACISFYPTKNLSALGDGGVVLTNDDKMATMLRRLRVHGSAEQYSYSLLGYANRLDELQAAFLRIKLRHLDGWNKRRHSLASRYDEALGEYVQVPRTLDGASHVYHQYTIRTPQRDDLRAFLREQSIPTGVYYPIPLHVQPAYSYLGYRAGDFPHSEAAAKEVLSLPIDPFLTDDEQGWVIDKILQFFGKESS